jgi:hypothetical protein
MTRIFGGHAERGLSARECVALAQQSYDVFHVVVMQGYAARTIWIRCCGLGSLCCLAGC